MDTASLVHFDQQVAGHDQLMALPTSDLIVVKPCKKKELEFYQDAHTFPEFQDLLPECYGTVRAATENDLKILDDSALIENKTIKIDTSNNEDHILFYLQCALDLPSFAIHP